MELPVNKILCGDCLEVMKDWPDNCVDLVLTDPPYNVGFKYDVYKDNRNDYWDWCKLWLEVFMRISKNVTFTCGWPRLAGWCILKKPTCFLYWYKPACMGFGPFGFTHIEPMPVYGKVKMNGTHDVITAPIIVVKDKTHPTPKPIKWALRAILKFNKTNIILDPFNGSGTTCVAAKMLGRRYIGIDISEKYCEIARQRLEAVDTGVPVKEQNWGQKPLFPISKKDA